VGKIAEEEKQMYPQRSISRQALELGLVVLVILTVSACRGGSGAKSRAAEEASKPELTTVAGDGGEQLGDGGPATEAGLCGPTDVALDAKGNMYISNAGDYCDGPGDDTVRKVDPDGTITTFAGTGEYGFSGDGGPATKARLYSPYAVAVDRDGNLYIGDGFNYRIRKVDKDGIIHTVAGTRKEGYSGDGGPATKAALNLPTGIALDGEGDLYIACHHNSRVRKVDKDGKITTVAGTGEWGFNREKGPATKVWLNQPWEVYFDDDSGVLYIADTFNARIRALRLEGS
jgi:hypothetical protein